MKLVLVCLLLFCLVIVVNSVDVDEGVKPHDSFCPGIFRRVLLSPFSEAASCGWNGFIHLVTLHPLMAAQYWIDTVLWSSVYTIFEVLSIFGITSSPSCGFARVAPCEHYPCWIFFEPDSSTLGYLVDCAGLVIGSISGFFAVLNCLGRFTNNKKR
uniref:Uncharacterized protein n=1 Tax=Vannella robusta TaxID=1487602 RepID=A0A7S4IIX0_9EUKA